MTQYENLFNEKEQLTKDWKLARENLMKVANEQITHIEDAIWNKCKTFLGDANPINQIWLEGYGYCDKNEKGTMKRITLGDTSNIDYVESVIQRSNELLNKIDTILGKYLSSIKSDVNALKDRVFETTLAIKRLSKVYDIIVDGKLFYTTLDSKVANEMLQTLSNEMLNGKKRYNSVVLETKGE